MTFKRLFVSLFICLLLCCTFIAGYLSVSEQVFADTVTDGWYEVTTNEELADAFRYYCKSRDLTIEGSVADALTKFTTKTFNGLCNTLGIDITSLQGELKYRTDGNYGLRFLFSSTGITAYNRIFSQFLQDNDLSVGDSVNNKSLYDGYSYNGNLIYLFSINDSVGTKYYSVGASIVTVGTIYPHNANYYISQYNGSSSSLTFPVILPDGTFNHVVYYTGMGGNYESIFAYNTSSTYGGYYWRKNYSYKSLGDCLFYNQYNQTLHYGVVGKVGTTYYFMSQHAISTGNVSNDAEVTNIYITTNNNTINNNTYEGDTVINNEGDVINNDNDTTINYNPYPGGGGTTSNPNNTGGGSGEDDSVITFPDFDFHFPEIDWSLGDLSEKFPFSIPFDLIAFFTVLNAEPQAPAINADIPLGNWYTWHFEADFAQFDNWAVIIRNVEFIAFCVGLIYLTIKLVKG